MSLWLVRGDRHGQYHDLALENAFAYVNFSVPDLSPFTTREEVFDLYRQTFPDDGEGRLRNRSAQAFTFAKRIKPGDLVAMPFRDKPQIAIGRVTGQYCYRNDMGDVHHALPVEWGREDLPRTVFGQVLLYSLGAVMTVCQIKRNNAEPRVTAILKGEKDPGYLNSGVALGGKGVEDAEKASEPNVWEKGN